MGKLLRGLVFSCSKRRCTTHVSNDENIPVLNDGKAHSQLAKRCLPSYYVRLCWIRVQYTHNPSHHRNSQTLYRFFSALQVIGSTTARGKVVGNTMVALVSDELIPFLVGRLLRQRGTGAFFSVGMTFWSC
jgi:hypothetical protein